MRYVLILLLLVTFSHVVGMKSANCNLEGQISTIIKQSINSDICYYFDFEKDKIPKGEILFFNELVYFEDAILVKADSSINLDMESKNVGSNYAFVAFNSGLSNEGVYFEVLLYRKDHFTNLKAKTTYLKYKRYNIGIRYHFILDDDNCIENYSKKAVSYD